MDSATKLAALHTFLTDLADELAEDSSGDGGEERDPIGVGWQRACEHYAAEIRKKLTEVFV
uniref:hypothetical protein n=1 Tax=Paractinoplanes polyasparticus TaxID=2856853 RepID=UPI001C84A73B|nr:hypothetical protein [Actinoplanes polyasparticus]